MDSVSAIDLPLEAEHRLTERIPFLWLNERWQAIQTARCASRRGLDNVYEANRKLQQFAGLLSLRIAVELSSRPCFRGSDCKWQ